MDRGLLDILTRDRAGEHQDQHAARPDPQQTRALRKRLGLTAMQYRAVVEYSEGEGNPTQQELAERFGVQQSAISRRLARARQRLAQRGVLLDTFHNRARRPGKPVQLSLIRSIT